MAQLVDLSSTKLHASAMVQAATTAAVAASATATGVQETPVAQDGD